MSNLSTVDLKIKEIIDILLLHPEVEAPPENYRELGEHLVKFKLQNSQDSLEGIFSMVSTFEVRGCSEEFVALEDDEPWDEEDIDESGGEPDNGDFWREGLEETGGSYASNENFLTEFGEAEYLSNSYNKKYHEEYKSSPSGSKFTAVERNVVLGLTTRFKNETGGYNDEFATKMLDGLKLVGFSTDQVWEIMTQYLNPELQQEFDTHEYN
jgi:hypothetical protein